MNIDILDFIILFGKTGTGKSEILRALNKKGEQVLDLEKFANHNGSAFGGIAKKQQPSQEAFEEEIIKTLTRFKADKVIWVEYESTYLGTLQIPDQLFHKMSQSKMLILNLDRDDRINRIVESYAQHSNTELLEASSKLKKKLSLKKYRLARKSIINQDYKTAASIFLTYYDKVYENRLKDDRNPFLGEIALKSNTNNDNADQILANYKSTLLKSRNPE